MPRNNNVTCVTSRINCVAIIEMQMSTSSGFQDWRFCWNLIACVYVRNHLSLLSDLADQQAI